MKLLILLLVFLFLSNFGTGHGAFALSQNLKGTISERSIATEIPALYKKTFQLAKEFALKGKVITKRGNYSFEMNGSQFEVECSSGNEILFELQRKASAAGEVKFTGSVECTKPIIVKSTRTGRKLSTLHSCKDSNLENSKYWQVIFTDLGKSAVTLSKFPSIIDCFVLDSFQILCTDGEFQDSSNFSVHLKNANIRGTNFELFPKFQGNAEMKLDADEMSSLKLNDWSIDSTNFCLKAAGRIWKDGPVFHFESTEKQTGSMTLRDVTATITGSTVTKLRSKLAQTKFRSVSFSDTEHGIWSISTEGTTNWSNPEILTKIDEYEIGCIVDYPLELNHRLCSRGPVDNQASTFTAPVNLSKCTMQIRRQSEGFKIGGGALSLVPLKSFRDGLVLSIPNQDVTFERLQFNQESGVELEILTNPQSRLLAYDSPKVSLSDGSAFLPPYIGTWVDAKRLRISKGASKLEITDVYGPLLLDLRKNQSKLNATGYLELRPTSKMTGGFGTILQDLENEGIEIERGGTKIFPNGRMELYDWKFRIPQTVMARWINKEIEKSAPGGVIDIPNNIRIPIMMLGYWGFTTVPGSEIRRVQYSAKTQPSSNKIALSAKPDSYLNLDLKYNHCVGIFCDVRHQKWFMLAKLSNTLSATYRMLSGTNFGQLRIPIKVVNSKTTGKFVRGKGQMAKHRKNWFRNRSKEEIGDIFGFPFVAFNGKTADVTLPGDKNSLSKLKYLRTPTIATEKSGKIVLDCSLYLESLE